MSVLGQWSMYGTNQRGSKRWVITASVVTWIILGTTLLSFLRFRCIKSLANRDSIDKKKHRLLYLVGFQEGNLPTVIGLGPRYTRLGTFNWKNTHNLYTEICDTCCSLYIWCKMCMLIKCTIFSHLLFCVWLEYDKCAQCQNRA